MKSVIWAIPFVLATLLASCAANPPTGELPPAGSVEIDFSDVGEEYIIGPADRLDIFVFQNPDISREILVQPDGQVAIPLVGLVEAIGKTPEQLADDIETALTRFINEPNVSVTPVAFAGLNTLQIRILGEAVQPATIPYRARLTLLDVIIAVGGLTQYADGNRAVIVREVDGTEQSYRVYLDSLVRNGDISRNVDMLPGDVVIIPQRYF